MPRSTRSLTARAGRSRLPRMEGLEARELLAGDLPSIIRIEADNRGLVTLTSNANLDASTINGNSVRVFTSGNDRLLDTADDTPVSVTEISYDIATKTIRLLAPVTANARYKVVLNASLIKDGRGRMLDGEFNGANTISGDGVAGGDLVFFTRAPAAQVARVTTFAGVIDIDLLADRAPISVANFLSYANDLSYDNNMFHRNALSGGVPFVVQGGGFKATTGFPSVTQKPAIQNEFGLSNTRGTIAMAKLGGNPNSATNQFFFNLGDNSANLDNQNGGFTVFARVRNAEGLAVMDALAAFRNFDATAQNNNFADLPVRDLDAVQARGSATPADVITINRIALLVDIDAEPGQQETAPSFSFTGAGGQVVSIIDLTGNGFTATDFVSVKFGSGNTVSSITLGKDFNGSAAIIVTGASRVGTITDQRSTTQGTIGYIALQDASLGSLSMRGDIVGARINGFVIAPGFELPADIDGDGVTNDLTAVFAPGTGTTSSISVRGNLTGSVTLGGALLQTRITGDASHADFRTGGSADDIANYVFGNTDNSSITTAQRINTLRAANWRVSETARKTITAPQMNNLTVSGAGGAAGVFEAQLTLTGAVQGSPSTIRTLGSASIKGGVYSSTWTISGNAGSLNVGPVADRWTLSVTGNAIEVRMGRAVSTNVTVTGDVSSFRATEWFTGRARAGTFRDVRVSPGRGAEGGDGSFEGTLDTTNTTATTAINTAAFHILRNATIDARTVLNRISVNESTGSSITGRSGLTTAKLGNIASTNISAQNQSQRITIKSWDGGNLLGGTVRALTVNGNARFNSTSVGAVLNMSIGGNLTTNLTTGGGFNWHIGGDLVNSEISLTFAQTINSILSFKVGGTMLNSNFRTARSIQSAIIGAMNGSGIYAGAPTGQVGLPPSAANTNDSVRIDRLRVFGRGSGDSFVNSFIVTGRLRNATIVRPAINNNETTHGVAANRITNFTANVNRRDLVFSAPDRTITSLGDFRIQVNPAVA